MSLPIVGGEFRVVADPELRFAPSGTAVAKVRLVASSRKQENGNWVDDKTLWLSAKIFGELAEHVTESLAKGDLCVVSGRLVTEEWEKDGQKQSMIGLLVDAIGPSNRFRITKHGDPEPAAAAPAAASGGSESEPPF